jgi:hypothetical protein
VHDYFLPCEGVLGWRRKAEPRPRLDDFIHGLRSDNWQFASSWGPVPGSTEYATLPEAEGVAAAERRFGLLFEVCDALNPRAPKAKAAAK